MLTTCFIIIVQIIVFAQFLSNAISDKLLGTANHAVFKSFNQRKRSYANLPQHDDPIQQPEPFWRNSSTQPCGVLPFAPDRLFGDLLCFHLKLADTVASMTCTRPSRLGGLIYDVMRAENEQTHDVSLAQVIYWVQHTTVSRENQEPGQ